MLQLLAKINKGQQNLQKYQLEEENVQNSSNSAKKEVKNM